MCMARIEAKMPNFQSAIAGSMPKTQLPKGQEFATMQKALATAKRQKPMKKPTTKGRQKPDFASV